MAGYSQKVNLRVCITIPVLNEERQLPDSIGRLAAFLDAEAGFECDIVIADNGSTDGTWVLARLLTEHFPNVEVMHQDMPGRGRALKAAWTQSQAEILSYMDVDLSTDLAAFTPLVQAVVSGSFDVAIGTRLHPESVTRRCWKRELISRCYNRLVRLVFGVHFSDAQCGFKAITRQAAAALLPQVEDTGWFFDTELLVLAEKNGFRMYEQPVRWTEDPDSRVRLVSTAWADLRGMWRLRRKLNSNRR